MPGLRPLRPQAAAPRKELPLRVYLRRLIWLCILPLVLLAIYLGFDSVRQIRAAADRASVRLVSEIASAVDQTLQARMDALSVLSNSPLLDDLGQLAGFYRAAQSMRDTYGGEVILADPQGRMLVHTGHPFGTALPMLPLPAGNAAVPLALASGRPAVGDSFIGPPSQTRLVAIAVPLGQAGKDSHVLLTILDVRRLQQVVDRVSLPQGWSVVILDGAQVALAARPAPTTGPPGESDGGRLVVASKVAPWSVVLVGSAQSRMAPVASAAQALAVAILAATLIGLLAGKLASRRLASSVASLASDGPAPAPENAEIAEIAAVRRRLEASTRQREADAALRASDIAVQRQAKHDLEQQRLQAQAQLRSRDMRLTGLIESAMDAIVSVNVRHEIVLFNAAAEDMFGYERAAVMGRKLEVLVPPRYHAGHNAHIDAFLRTGITARRMGRLGQVAGLRADGTEFPAEASISQVRHGDETTLTVILRDVTERMQAEQARSKLEAQLLQAQKMEALGTLAGGIAHDFNNILTAISGNVELARLDAGADSPLQHNLAEIAKATHRATDLVRQILTFSRNQPLERVVVDLRESVLEAVKLLRSTLPTGIELVTTLAPDAPNVLADRTQLHQVLLNLVVNAAQAIGKQPGRIEIALAGATVNDEARVAALAPGRYAVLVVTDNGPGMDAATRQRIFDPFFTTKPVGEGTGLGLAVVDGIVKRLGGAITVYSEPARGCAFRLYFPAVAASAVDPVAPSPSARRTGSSQRVLYLDDEAALVLIGQAMLRRLGYRVDAYTDAGRALAAFEADPTGFDALISDFNMPGTSGLGFAAKVLRLRPDLPVALASGLVTDDLLTQAQALGVREVLYKPHSLDDLAGALHRMLAGRV